MSASKHTKRTFYPPKSFDDDLEAFVRLARTEGWYFSGVDLEQLAQDVVEQSTERSEHDAAEARFRALHEAFGQAQNARYRRFTAALNAARAAFQCDPAIASKLDRFRRDQHRSLRGLTAC
jgi:hypothetical protein